MQRRVWRWPGLPKTGRVSRPIAAVTQPVQLHAKCLQIRHGRRFLRMPAQQADSGKAETLARRRQRMEVIGMRPTETDDAFGTDALGGLQVLVELEPFVAADQRV